MSSSAINVSPQRLHELQGQGEEIELIDVRTAAEYGAGHASGARCSTTRHCRSWTNRPISI